MDTPLNGRVPADVKRHEEPTSCVSCFIDRYKSPEFVHSTKKKKIDAAIQTERADAASLRTGWRTDRVVLGGG